MRCLVFCEWETPDVLSGGPPSWGLEHRGLCFGCDLFISIFWTCVSAWSLIFTQCSPTRRSLHNTEVSTPRADASVDALRTPGHMSSKRQQTKTPGEPGERQPVVLVDMDGTIADFDARAYALLAERHPEVKLPPFEQRVYPLSRGVPASQRPLVTALFKEAGFFRELAPIEGAVEALRQMVA